MKTFKGSWATFESVEDTERAIIDLRGSGFEEITVHSPFPIRSLDAALGKRRSQIPVFTLIGGILGLAISVFLVVWMSIDWIIPVSAKPIVAVPVMVPVVFELTILFMAIFTLIGLVILITGDIRRSPLPSGIKYKNYHRFLRDRCGIVVFCDGADVGRAESILKRHRAEEVIVED